MVDDNPQDLVHDLAAEAVFGSHPARAPGDRECRGDRDRLAAGTAHVPRWRVRRLERRARRLGPHRARAARRAVRRATAGRSARVAGASHGCSPAHRHRDTGSSAGARSSTTSCLAGPASPATTSGATPCRCSTRSSAAPRRRASFRKSARSGVWHTASTRTDRSTRRPVRSGSTSARARTTWRECLAVTAAALDDVAAGNLRAGELERAKENLKGRLLLSLESTSSRMTRLGQGARHRNRARLDRRDDSTGRRGRAGGRRRGRAELFAMDQLSVAGIGPRESRFRAALARVRPELVAS